MDDRRSFRLRAEVDLVPRVDNEGAVAFCVDPPGVVVLSRFALLTLLCLDGRPLAEVASGMACRLEAPGHDHNRILRSFWLSVGQLDGQGLVEEVDRVA